MPLLHLLGLPGQALQGTWKVLRALPLLFLPAPSGRQWSMGSGQPSLVMQHELWLTLWHFLLWVPLGSCGPYPSDPCPTDSCPIDSLLLSLFPINVNICSSNPCSMDPCPFLSHKALTQSMTLPGALALFSELRCPGQRKVPFLFCILGDMGAKHPFLIYEVQ